MANAVSSNPLVIDTASASAITTEMKKVMAFLFTGGAATNGCIVKDKNGNTIWDVVAETNNTEKWIQFTPPLLCHGLAVTTLGGGKCLIYLAR